MNKISHSVAIQNYNPIFIPNYDDPNRNRTYPKPSHNPNSNTGRLWGQVIHGGPKIGTFFTPYNYIQYWPIVKLISLSESGENL